MKHSEHALLMHTVLDGEASPGEVQDLERLLASNPATREEFQDLQRLFDGLKGVPKAFPPEGLVHSVMASLPPHGQHRPAGQRPAGWGRVLQLFSRSRVIGASSNEAPGANPGKSATVHPISQRGPSSRGKNMSEQNNSSVGKRKIWIGAGIAAAAAIVAVSTGVLPPSGKDTAGTIVPATRYQAPQNTAADVKLGDPSAMQSAQTSPVGGANAGGVNSGGVNSGGVNSGGVNSGGVNSGGVNSGGVNSGGVNSGGVNSGGVNSSGVNSGGVNSGGVNSSGVNSSGVNSGGVNRGGVNSGGVNSGGVNSSGVNSGGVNSGGVNSGGVNSGGVNSGGVNSGGVNSGSVNSSSVNAGGVQR
jgi:anti-sigma factor RsiW